MSKRASLAWACVLFALMLSGTAAHAGLLRCLGPDGKMIYTDNKALCPEAKPFEPKGEIQSTKGTPSRRSVPASESPTSDRLHRAKARLRAADAEEAEAQGWRDRKSQLEQSLEKIVERREYFEKFVTLCNRGGSVITRDEAGIKRTVKCSSIRSQHASLGAEAEKVREEIAGLPEACRRAGCLPGWLR